jgi:hypothetical protein
LALSVPLSRFTSQVGGGSAFYVRLLPTHHMKTIRIILVLAFLLVTASTSFALIQVETISKERAKELGATISAKMVGTNQVGVWLEFAPKGRLQNFSSVTLEITSGEQRLVSATLSPLKQTPDSVVVYFSTNPVYLATSTLMVFYKSSGIPPYDAFRFDIRDFVTHESLH